VAQLLSNCDVLIQNFGHTMKNNLYPYPFNFEISAAINA